MLGCRYEKANSTWLNTKCKRQIQNTKHKIQNTKHKIQNTKYKIQNTKYKIQNTMYARLPAQHYCTFHKYIHKYKIQNTKYKIQNTKYKIKIQSMPDYPHNITAPSTNTSTNTKYKTQN